MPDGRAKTPTWLRYSSLGLELGAAIAVPTLLGTWIDGKWGLEPWGVLTGLCLGMVGGLYHFIRSSVLALRQAGVEDRHERDLRRLEGREIDPLPGNPPAEQTEDPSEEQPGERGKDGRHGGDSRDSPNQDSFL